jgi:riboflavin synthase
VVKVEKKAIQFDVIRPTFFSTNLCKLRYGHKVNFERALKLTDRISGHFVTGHIDGLGKIIRIKRSYGSLSFSIQAEKQLLSNLVVKGSVALDGVSLTVAELRKDIFIVNLIPFTLKHTTLGEKRQSDLLNIETDILLKKKG